MYRISKPTLFVDCKRVVKNIERMFTKARKSNIRFRPHFKTHQSLLIGRIFRDFGVKAITVSSLDMALYFSRDGWNDITVAFPVNILEIDKVNFLASRINLNLLLDSKDAVNLLSKRLLYKVNIYLKVDTGYGRAGIYYKDVDNFKKIISLLKNQSKIQLKGLLSHFGNTYYAKSVAEIRKIYSTSLNSLINLKSELMNLTDELEISIGDTPSCSVIDDFKGIDEIRPGNFVFYDYKMLSLGVCRERDIAIAVGCPVVAIYKERNEVLAYCGAIHLSKDSVNLNGKEIFGIPVKRLLSGWAKIKYGNIVKSISQEHSILKLSDNFMNSLKIGSIVFIIPVHSCLTADCMKSYITLDGRLFDHM